MKRTLKAAIVAATALSSLAVAGTASAADETIVEIASSNDDFSTLVAAITAAGLTGPFDECSDDPTTVFAPTNDAIAAALDALGITAADLLGDTELLTSILTYHVVSGAVMAADVVELDSATTLEGSDIAIAVVDGGVVLNGNVNVTATDLEACNGVIHVIDAVLLPPSLLPATGFDSSDIALLAGGLMFLGAGLTFGLRRRTVLA
jgi:transforming growth factor-beta-induced protein